MHPGNTLHGLAVALGQTTPVHMLEHAGIGFAVPGNGNVFFRR